MPDYLSRWDPFREVISLREAMDHLMDESATANGRRSQAARSGQFRLPIDAYVTPEAIIVVANMPGVKPDDVEITLEGDTLTIRGQRPAPMDNVDYVIQERLYGSFQRVLNINVPVDAAKAEAHYENGLLTLTIPKAEAARPKTIQVVSREAKEPAK